MVYLKDKATSDRGHRAEGRPVCQAAPMQLYQEITQQNPAAVGFYDVCFVLMAADGGCSLCSKQQETT